MTFVKGRLRWQQGCRLRYCQNLKSSLLISQNVFQVENFLNQFLCGVSSSLKESHYLWK